MSDWVSIFVGQPGSTELASLFALYAYSSMKVQRGKSTPFKMVIEQAFAPNQYEISR